ncbi:hypothetical protein SAMN05216178_6719 [Pseudomonas saponiphila]|uniref:Uncharacterized protein n=2 Tax=Pseudomonas saponiphila TaxID=556534 RepID=A0A1H4ZL22_9PSED|nr:hypothetical protein SAMN05216178_6719 [Pseudomonas saponiphila]
MNSPAMPSTRTYALGVGRIPEFRLVYQPIFKVGPEGESEPFAYEALLRVEEEGILASANNHILHHEGLVRISEHRDRPFRLIVTAHFGSNVTDSPPVPKQVVTAYRNRRSRLSESLPLRCA